MTGKVQFRCIVQLVSGKVRNESPAPTLLVVFNNRYDAEVKLNKIQYLNPHPIKKPKFKPIYIIISISLSSKQVALQWAGALGGAPAARLLAARGLAALGARWAIQAQRF